MNNTQKTTAVVAVASALVAGYVTLSKNATLDHLNERFPDLDPKIAKRTYKKIMRDALRGKMNFDNWSEAQFDALFLQEYRKIASMKP
jgi:hypothetical protein